MKNETNVPVVKIAYALEEGIIFRFFWCSWGETTGKRKAVRC